MKQPRCSIVLGTFFGDEGKGLTTSYLAQSPNHLVIRFNGGFQAGHTVIKGDRRHVFSSFGSGTLNHAHTYWSEYCPVYPTAFNNERDALLKSGINPAYYVHPLAPVTTIYDLEFNRATERWRNQKHGSVGVGFGATMARHEESHIKLYVKDLFYEAIFVHKLELIRKYYEQAARGMGMDYFVKDSEAASFENHVRKFKEGAHCSTLAEIKGRYNNFVFEGAQGIMLDMDHGFFPNVTRSNTTSKNAMQIIKENGLPVPEICYVMRSYLTRHGNGFMPNESEILLKNNEKETNVQNEWQGQLRYGYHCSDMLKYALETDLAFSGHDTKKNFVITCLDQTDNQILIDKTSLELNNFSKYIEFTKILISHNKGETLRIHDIKESELI